MEDGQGLAHPRRKCSVFGPPRVRRFGRLRRRDAALFANLPAKIIPAKIACLKLSGKSPMGMRIPPIKTKIMLESNTPKSRILVRRLAVGRSRGRESTAARGGAERSGGRGGPSASFGQAGRELRRAWLSRPRVSSHTFKSQHAQSWMRAPGDDSSCFGHLSHLNMST